MADSAADDDGTALEAEPAAVERLFGERSGLARRYADALATDGVVRGLIGPREPARLWTRHLLNSALIAQLINPGATVVDIGSGAGLPGIPLAIARPDLQVTLVEPLERRTRFLVEITGSLGLDNCRVVRGRAEEVVSLCGNADVVTSRAVAPLHRLVTWSAPLARDGGVVLAMKGSSAAEELVRDEKAVAAAGLVAAEVLEIGGGQLGEPTFVIRAVRQSKVNGGARAGRGTQHQARSARKPR